MPELGPAGERHDAPATANHQGAVFDDPSNKVESPSNRPVKTKDQPNRSASVTYPVADMKEANLAFVTAWASIRNAETLSRLTGSSPSPGWTSSSSLPITNSLDASAIRCFLTAPECRVRWTLCGWREPGAATGIVGTQHAIAPFSSRLLSVTVAPLR